MTLQGTNTSRVFGVYLMSPTTARRNTKARRKDPQLLAPAAAQAAVISVKAKKMCFPISSGDERARSEWVFTGPIWLLCFFLNFFQPQLPNAHSTQPPYRFLVCEITQTITAYLHHCQAAIFLLLHQWYQRGFRVLCSCDGQYPNPMQVPKLGSKEVPSLEFCLPYA